MALMAGLKGRDPAFIGCILSGGTAASVGMIMLFLSVPFWASGGSAAQVFLFFLYVHSLLHTAARHCRLPLHCRTDIQIVDHGVGSIADHDADPLLKTKTLNQ